MAEPVVDDISLVSPLELFVVTFETHYYTTSQGRKKLYQVEQEIKNLINIRHPKLLSVYALKLVFPPNGLPILMVLMEQTPALTLHDVLEDCEAIREDRASVRMSVFLVYLPKLFPIGLCRPNSRSAERHSPE
jgi:translation initiation factor 2-alpha kinase 4